MQEHAVTVAGKRYKMNEPYFVLATQNPIEQEGTYPLPEAQLDRFMFAVYLNYPSFEEEIEVVKLTTGEKKDILEPVLDSSQIKSFIEVIRKMPIADNVVEYAVNLVSKTRPNSDRATEFISEYVSWGAGPRASQNLVLASKTHAAINGKYSPDIEDVKAVAVSVLRHRVIKNYKAEAENISDVEIINSIL